MDKKCHSKSEMRRLEHMMNVPAWCNYCREETKTKEWDCVICGFSKGHPVLKTKKKKMSSDREYCNKCDMLHDPENGKCLGCEYVSYKKRHKDKLITIIQSCRNGTPVKDICDFARNALAEIDIETLKIMDEDFKHREKPSNWHHEGSLK